jgi:hypothetical protein
MAVKNSGVQRWQSLTKQNKQCTKSNVGKRPKENKRRGGCGTQRNTRETAGEGKQRGTNLHVRQNHLVSVQAGANGVGLGVLNKAEHDLA